MATNRKGDVELVVSAKNEATQTINELIKSLEKLGKEAGASGVGGFFRELAGVSKDLSASQAELTNALNATKVAQDKLKKANDGRERDLRKQQDVIDKTTQSLAELNVQYDDLAAAAKKAQTPSETLVNRLEKQEKKAQSLAGTIEETATKLQQAQVKLDQNQGVDQTASKNIQERTKKVKELGQAWRETTNSVKDAQAVLAQSGQVRDVKVEGHKQAQDRLVALRKERDAAKALEKEKKAVVRNSKKATSEQIKAHRDAIANVERLKVAVEEQVQVEREARAERNASISAYNKQEKATARLIDLAEKQKKAFVELKASLAAYTQEQKELGSGRQRDNIQKLTASLQTLEGQLEDTKAKLQATQATFNEKSGPDPRAIARFDALKQKIAETEREIKEQTGVLNQMEAEYKEAGAAADQLARKEKELEKITEELTKEQKRLGLETDKTASATRKAGAAAKQASNQFRMWGKGSRTTLSFLQRIRGELLAIGAAYGGVYAIGGAIRSIYSASVVTEKATARLTARLGNDQQQIAKEMAFVERQADRLGMSYGSLLDQYTRFISAVPEGELTLDQIKFSFTAVAEAARVAGLSVADVQGVFTALSQLAGKGINLEDLRQQLQERIPGATEALRVGLSELEGQYVSLEEVLDRINKSTLSGAAIVPLALGLRRMFEKGLPVAVDSAQAAIGRFNTQLFKTQLALSESGVIEVLVKGLKAVTAEMRTPEFKEGMVKLGQGIVAVIDFLVLLVKNFDTLVAVFKTILALKVASFVTAIGIQIGVMAAAVSKSVGSLTLMSGAMATLRATAIALVRGILLLPAAFYAGFAIGDQLQKQFPIFKKIGFELVAVMETAAIESKRHWDLFLLQFEGGWIRTLKNIANFILTAIPKAILKLYGYLGNFVGLFSDDLGDSITEAMEGLSQSLDKGTDSFLDGLLDTSDVDKKAAEINATADKELKLLNQTIQEMYNDLEARSNTLTVIDADRLKRELDEFGEEFEATLKDIDYTRIGSNAGKQLADSLLDQFKAISRTFEEESATTLDQRLALIKTEFQEFLNTLGEFNVNANSAVTELQRKEAESIAAIKARSGLSEEAREKSISAIKLRTEAQIAAIRADQAAVSGAGEKVTALVKLRQDALRRADAEQKINDVVSERKKEIGKVNDLAELGLISAEEQAQRIKQINTEAFEKMKEAIDKARILAEETNNIELKNLVDDFEGWEEVEQRRAAIEEVLRLEEQINQRYALRQTQLDTLNTQRELGTITAADAEEKAKEILESSNAELRSMIDNAITLARALGDDALVASLTNMREGLADYKKEVLDSAQFSQAFASGFTDAFSKIIQGTETASDALRRFFANFLQMIADAIVQALVLKAITGSFTGGAGGEMGGFIGAINSLFAHSGGVVGSGGTRKNVSPLAFAGAVRYHAGGIAGLKPNEVPTVLERGEEVLTRNDPRHVANGGAAVAPEVKVVNTIDSGSFVSEGMNSGVGQTAMMNFIKANKGRIKGILG